jgi:hypothetical protein
MAGTLTISTLSDGTNSTSATNPIKGSAKAWVQFQGASGTINASYNVSSVTRNSTGDYTVTYTNAFSDANYAFAVSSQWAVSTNNSTIVWNSPTTTTLNIATGTPSNSARADFTLVSAICFR